MLDPAVDHQVASPSGPSAGGLSKEAMQEWSLFLARYKAGDFPRDAPPPIPEVIQRLLDSPAALPTPVPSWLNSKWARPESPEELLAFFQIHRYLPSPVSEDEENRRAIIRRFGLDDTNRLASIDEIADLGRIYFKNTTVIVTAVLEDVVILLGQAALPTDSFDWGGALRHLDQSLSLCRHGMLGKREDTFLISDACADWRVRDNPVFAQAGGPLSFYASSRVLLPLTDTPSSPGAEAPSLAIGNFCLLGTEPRKPGDFTDEDHAVLRNLAKRVSRELQLGYQERRRVRAQDQANFVSRLLQESQACQPELSRRESPGMHAVTRDQLSNGLSNVSTAMAASLASAIKGMCSLSSATNATIVDMRAFVKSSVESSATIDPRRPTLRRGRTSLLNTQDGNAVSWLSPVTVLGSSESQGNLEERLNKREILLGLERALKQWKLDQARHYLLGDALAVVMGTTSTSRLTIPIVDHAQNLALLILVSEDDGALLEPSDKVFFDNIGLVLLSRLVKEQALQADHAKLAFVSQISHELRTPLHGLAGQLELIRAASTSTPRAPLDPQAFAIADVCLESLREILDDTLSFATLSQADSTSSQPKIAAADETEVVDLAELLRDTTRAAWARKIRRDCADGQTEEDGADVRVMLDLAGRKEGWLAEIATADWRRTFSNLLANAFTFTPAGGQVTVKLFESPASCAGSSSVTVQIQDTGCGIADDFVASGGLFMPFRQGDSFSPGSGLGLAIVQELVARMKGRVDVQSVVGRGTQVEVVLPVVFVPSAPAAPCSETLAEELNTLRKVLVSPTLPKRSVSRKGSIQASPLSDSSSSTSTGMDESGSETSIRTPPTISPGSPMLKSAGGRRLLNVYAAEDNAIARNILSAMFTQQKGFNFFAVEDGQKAVDVFKGGLFRPDVTIMDIQMPRKDGIAASWEIREHEQAQGWNRHRIIALTGLSNPEDMSKGLDEGGPIDAWVCKGGSALRHIGEEIEAMRVTLTREEEEAARRSGL